MRRRAWKAIRDDGTTRNGFSWNVGTGGTVRSDHDIDPDNRTACPTRPGDGLCLAKTWAGAALARFPTRRCLIVEFDQADILAEDYHKIRVRGEVRVIEEYDAWELLRAGFGAGAIITFADLTGAQLTGADLTDAWLADADLTDADLGDARLTGARLVRARLVRADLAGADLTGARLARADLAGARLTRSQLLSARRDTL